MKTLVLLLAFALLGTTLVGASGALDPQKSQHRLHEEVRCWSQELQPQECRP